ncbi:hypothetical protein [Arthrobacter sp. B1805]|uniref:hypothetical protein n=1 Tax=Arthrobacter sp. B1805 TaxID=2058892 RepID=UPI000CE3D279|nr:hypothetical protein [Arthrobacter sp. B1805]
MTKHAIIETGVPTARRPLNEHEEWSGLVELAAAHNVTIRVLGKNCNWHKGEAARVIRCLELDETDLLISEQCTPLERIAAAHHVLLQLMTTEDRDLRWELVSAKRSPYGRAYAHKSYFTDDWVSLSNQGSEIHTESKGWG